MSADKASDQKGAVTGSSNSHQPVFGIADAVALASGGLVSAFGHLTSQQAR